MTPGKVLVVDDEADVREVCRRGLSQLGFEVVEARSGPEALTLARDLDFDLLLLDFRMPGMDGLETFRAIRALQPEVLGVMMTAYAAVDNAVQAVNLGLSGFVLKPFKLDDLQRAVNAALAKREQERKHARALTLASLTRLSKAVGSVNLDETLLNVLKLARDETQSDAAAILLFANGKEGKQSHVSYGRDLECYPAVLEAILGSDRPLAFTAEVSGPVEVCRALRDGHLGGLAAAQLAVPQQEAYGVLYVARDAGSAPYSDIDLEALQMLVAQTSVVVSNARLFSQVVEGERLNQSLARYLSPRTVRAVLNGEIAPGAVGAERPMTVLLADVVDFVALVEKAEVESIIEVMHEYFSAAVEIISAHQGVVDELSGDEILASFDRSNLQTDDALRAVQAGLDMLARLDELRVTWSERGMPLFDIGIGVSSGSVAVGSIGSGERRALVTAGRILNLAARCQAMTRQTDLRLIVTQGTFEEVCDFVQYRELGAIRLKGIEEPVGLYGVYGLKQREA
jgi:CheY-like chemotaxis protein/class 3 adenylate cyclase